jgi:4-hydroxybenzoate-CoA ligase
VRAGATGSPNAADHFIDRHLREGRGERTVFTDPWRSLTYRDLRDAAARFGSGLLAAGIGPERRVALLLLDTVDFPIAFWGALRAGLVPVPINTLLPPEQVGYILADCRAEALIVAAPLLAPLAPLLPGLPRLRQVVVANPDGSAPDAGAASFAALLAAGTPEAAPAEAAADEVAFWLYSSGSTGAPKGVRHVHGALAATAETYGTQVLGILPEDVVFSAAKLFFAYGLGNAMTFPMHVGAAAILLPERPTPAAVLEVLRRHRPSIFCGVPTLYAALLAQPGLGPGAGSDRLRRCISAGEALPAHIGQRWAERTGVDILDGIGSTEMLHIFLSNRPDALRYGTTGRAVPGYQLRIVDAAEREVADGEAGELLVRGPSAAEGYWNRRDRSRRTFQGEWTRTGDTFVRDAEGWYRSCGRADDMLKVGGIWVSPFEVEEALASHPAVLEAAVVGQEDAEGLVKPKAFVVLQAAARDAAREGLVAELQEHVKTRIGAWKYPRWITVLEELPKTATGKIQRFRLRVPG